MACVVKDPLAMAHDFLAAALGPGEVAVDATAGNGNDTLVLARLVGASGVVYAFDVQPAALEATRARLAAGGLEDRVRLVCAGHESMDEHLPSDLAGRVGAVACNLGYLPGGDKSLVTRPETTLSALAAGLRLLRTGGVMTVALYEGHPGGAEEARAVRGWAANLDRADALACAYELSNHPRRGVRLLVVERRG